MSAAPPCAAVRSSLLDGLEPAQRAALSAHLRPREYKRGQVVFNNGETGDCMHLLQSGRVDVQLTTIEGHTIILRVVQPGEFFGEMALVHADSKRIGRVCALEPTKTYALYRRDFEAVRDQHPALDRMLVAALAERVAMTSRLAVELLMPPEPRLWRRLAMLADEYGDQPIRMSQDELAHTAGTVRQTASRVLNEGVRRGIITVDRCTIRVVDRAALERMSRCADAKARLTE